MMALTLNQEFSLMRLRFQRTLAISIGAHVLLFAWLMVNRHLAPMDLPVMEITWLEQPPAPAPDEQEIKPAPVTRAAPDLAPQVSVKDQLAGSELAAEQLRQRLAALQPSTVADKAVSGLAQASDFLTTAPATMAPVVRSGTPANLNRGPEAVHPAVALTRGATASHRAPAAVAALPTVTNGGSGMSAANPGTAASAVRNLGGATIKGMVADRQVLNYVLPTYPAWATAEAVEASVTLYFVVLPSGQVKENVQVQRLASQQDFDQNAVAALRQWRFEPLSGQETLEQWGTITFRYRLKD